MHRFFADEDSRIRGDEYKHLTRVLRLSAGDEIRPLAYISCLPASSCA